MNRTIIPSSLAGTLQAPASKSAMQRACALAFLREGPTTILNPGMSQDDRAALGIIKSLGAEVMEEEGRILIFPGLKAGETQKNREMQKERTTQLDPEPLSVDCGESGLSFRMFAPIAALSPQSFLLKGSGSLLNRPVDFFEKVFPQLGVTVSTHGGKPPVEVRGPLQPADITIDGSLSSQFLTGLLMAFAKAAVSPVTIRVSNLTSKPYIDLTLSMMEQFGYAVVHDHYERFFIKPTQQNDQPLTYTVEGDWSSAAFLLVAGAIAGPVTLKGLDVFSTQADKAILQILMQAGVPLSVSEQEIIVSPPALKKYQAFQFNARDCPDLFPPAVALAAYCQGISVIEGAGRLLHKESDRSASLKEEFGKMGITIEVQDDLMLVTGAPVKGARVNAHDDHRIAMACAVAALSAHGETTIEGAQAVNKSYPAFYDNLKMLGANVSLPLN